eukprot:366537-Chlamydomonas_euryale.AAC.18
MSGTNWLFGGKTRCPSSRPRTCEAVASRVWAGQRCKCRIRVALRQAQLAQNAVSRAVSSHTWEGQPARRDDLREGHHTSVTGQRVGKRMIFTPRDAVR